MGLREHFKKASFTRARTAQDHSNPGLKQTLQSYPHDILWSIPNQLAERLEEERLFIGVSRSPVDLNKRIPILEGTLRDFRPRDWYK